MPRSSSTSKRRAATPTPVRESADAASVHLLFGDDEYPRAEAVYALIDQLCPKSDREFGLEIIAGDTQSVADTLATIGQCLEALATPGFLGGRKTVWLRDVTFLYESQVGRNESVKKQLDALVRRIRTGLLAGQTLVISADKVDKRTAFYKACSAAGTVREFALPEKAYQAEELALQRAAEALQAVGLKATDDTVRVFSERVGADTRQLVQEANKLALYLGERREVRAEDILDICAASREAAFWDLSDAFGKRNMARVFTVLRRLQAQGEDPIGLIILLHGHLRALMLVRECVDRGWLRLSGSGWPDWNLNPEAETWMSSLGKRNPRQMHPYRLRMLAEQAGRFSLSELVHAHSLAVRTHERMVSGALEPHLLLELFLTHPAVARRAATAAS